MLTQMPAVHRRDQAIRVTTLAVIHLHDIEATIEGHGGSLCPRRVTRLTDVRHRGGGRALGIRRRVRSIGARPADRHHLCATPRRETWRAARRPL